MCLYFIGYRRQEIPAHVFGENFVGWLMSDGDQVYRQFHRDSAHEKPRALAREFLNDWEAIWIVVAPPHLPLTHNESQRALRHWVIARRLSQGTRTEQGSQVVALLASVIDTCRKRNILPWSYLAQVVAARRKGNSAPPLPAAR